MTDEPRKGTALIVDDDSAQRYLISRLLRRSGHPQNAIHEAADYDSAVTQFPIVATQAAPHLVFLDNYFISGFDAAKFIADGHPEMIGKTGLDVLYTWRDNGLLVPSVYVTATGTFPIDQLRELQRAKLIFAVLPKTDGNAFATNFPGLVEKIYADYATKASN